MAVVLALISLGLLSSPATLTASAGPHSGRAASQEPASCTPAEIPSARTRDSKTFRNADCTYTAMFGRYLHYEASPGQWEDVDLDFHPSGTDDVMDHHDVVVRSGGPGVQATERKTGKGIEWLTPLRPAASGRRAIVADQGLVWTYATRKSGIKLTATVQAPRGPQAYEFRYRLLGGASDLTVDEAGNLRSDVFSVPRALAEGADGRVYAAGPWRVLPGPRVGFDFDDSALPQGAFPYELDPTTTFSVAASSDDGYVSKTGNIYPPPLTSSTTVGTIGTTVAVMRSGWEAGNGTSPQHAGANGPNAPMFVAPTYEIRNALMRWDTSSLPDDAVVTGATLRARVSAKEDADVRSLTADWYADWPIDSPDYSETAQATALTGVSIASITTGADNDLALGNAGSNVSKTGFTGIRLHISGGQPGGKNSVTFVAYDHTMSPEPRLVVTYSTPPTITSAADSPDPVTAGDAVTFTVSWTDADPGDSVRAVICKTNAVSSGTCTGGAWAVGALSPTSPSTASFIPTAAQHGANTYYAFACDAAGACSPSPSSFSGTFTVQNNGPTITSVSDSPDPVTAGTSVTFSVGWTDPDDQVKAVICKTNAVSSGTCTGGAWAVGALSPTSPSTASYVTSGADVGTNTYYAFTCDAASACSGSLVGTFSVSNVPPSIISVADDPDPVTAGDPLTFTVGWTDPDDRVRAVVCKTNLVSAGASPSCPGGVWAIGSLSSTSPSTATYTPTAPDHGTQTYFAFVCDVTGACSGSLSGTFTVLNRTPTIIVAADSPDPLVEGDTVRFSVAWFDPGDSVRAVICMSDEVNAGTCPGGAWTSSNSSNSGTSEASYATDTNDWFVWDYWAFACDASNACSNSFHGTFDVRHDPLGLCDEACDEQREDSGAGGAPPEGPMPGTQPIAVTPNGEPATVGTSDCGDGFTPDGVLLCVPHPLNPTQFALAGRVESLATIAPVEGATVTLIAGQTTLIATSDPEGQFLFANVPAGPGGVQGTLRVQAAGFGLYEVSGHQFEGGMGYGVTALLETGDHIATLPYGVQGSGDAAVTGGGAFSDPDTNDRWDHRRVPATIKVELFKTDNHNCSSTTHEDPNDSFKTYPWKFYVLHTAVPEIGGSTIGQVEGHDNGGPKAKHYLRANLSAISNLAWYVRLVGRAISSNTNDQCFHPDYTVPDWWDAAARRPLEFRVVKGGFIQKTEYKGAGTDTPHDSLCNPPWRHPSSGAEGVSGAFYQMSQIETIHCANGNPPPNRAWGWMIDQYYNPPSDPTDWNRRRGRKPDKPTNFSASPGTQSGNVRLNWTPGTGTWSTVIEMFICEGSCSWQPLKTVTWKGELGDVRMADTSTISGLRSGQQYQFRIHAENPATRAISASDYAQATGTAQ